MITTLNLFYIRLLQPHYDSASPKKQCDGSLPMVSFPSFISDPQFEFLKHCLIDGSKSVRDIMIRAWSWCPPIQENTYATL